MQHVEGKAIESHTRKVDGGEETLVNYNVADGQFAKQAEVTGLESTYVSSGRTIELAPFEFARIDIGARAYHTLDKADAVYDALIEIVEAVIKAEEQEIAGIKRAKLDPTIASVDVLNNACVARSVSISYGLTLKGAKKFESHKIDVSRVKQIDDGEDIVAMFESVGKQVADRISERRERVSYSGPVGI